MKAVGLIALLAIPLATASLIWALHTLSKHVDDLRDELDKWVVATAYVDQICTHVAAVCIAVLQLVVSLVAWARARGAASTLAAIVSTSSSGERTPLVGSSVSPVYVEGTA